MVILQAECYVLLGQALLMKGSLASRPRVFPEVDCGLLRSSPGGSCSRGCCRNVRILGLADRKLRSGCLLSHGKVVVNAM